MRDDEFREWLKRAYPHLTDYSTPVSDCRKVDRHTPGGLDGQYDQDKLQAVLSGREPEARKVFDKSSSYKSSTKKYKEFRDSVGDGSYAEQSVSDPDAVASETEKVNELVFELEADMQRALRSQLDSLEEGLAVADNGQERRVAIGRIDITARDQAGQWVVVELKAGRATHHAVSQILSYMGALAEEENAPVRGILVAEDFDDRARYAAKNLPSLKLYKYAYRFSFEGL